MKRTIALLVLAAALGTAYGKHVPLQVARNASQKFLESATDAAKLKSGAELLLAHTEAVQAVDRDGPDAITDLYYVFNSGSTGFVIVAADDNVIPILGYSDHGAFRPDSVPQNVAKWLEGYKSQIRFIIENRIPATGEIASLWQDLQDPGSVYRSSGSTTTVNPLMHTTWDQSPYYNALCPGGSVTGCVATAMAQIMKFWNYPETGSGFHSYNHDKYGTLSANFGGAAYNWASMPDAVTGPNSAVATLMYHIGVSVDMDYSPESSGAYVVQSSSYGRSCSEYALKTYFGFKNTLQGLARSGYTDAQWMQMMKADLTAGRPILYAGFGSGGGHCFVADGIDRNDYIHMNWGWGGYYDGYFQINALNPNGVGTGGGSGGFNSGHQAVFGIQPPVVNQTYDLSLYDYVRPSTTRISYGQSFTVSTNIANFGTASFSGDYCAALFDTGYNFVEFVDSLTGYGLQPGYAYTDNLVFTSPVSYTLLPGSYYIGIFYRPAGGNWYQVSDNGNFTNLVQVTVVHPSDIELYSAITVTPGLTLTRGQPVSVNLNLINNGATTFTGEYYVGLYDIEGDLAQDVGTVTESAGLQHNYVYLAPYLTFSSSAITVEPGTYLLAVLHKPDGGSWQLTGSTNYQNPIRVKVVSPEIQPDRYENNNSGAQAYVLTASFSADKANFNTSGSNIHIASDHDFYKIVLPSGWNYTLSPRLHDSNNSGNGIAYTVDGLFSYSFDASKWSSAYDDVIGGTVFMRGGGTVYFQVAPYFAGETGSYLLDINITRTNASGTGELAVDDRVSVFPNPASDLVTLDLSHFDQKVVELNLVNLHGQNVYRKAVSSPEKVMRVPVRDMPDGVYFLQLVTEGRVVTRKLVVRK